MWHVPNTEAPEARAEPQAPDARAEQVPGRYPQARRVRERPRPHQPQNRQASQGPLLLAARKPRQPRGRRLPLHCAQSQHPRHQPQRSHQTQPPLELLWEEGACWLRMRLNYIIKVE